MHFEVFDVNANAVIELETRWDIMIMIMNINIRMADLEEASIVGGLIYDMECELWPDQSNSFKRTKFEKTAQMLLQPDTGLWAFVASRGRQIVGALTLNECAAIYAGGYFGEIADVYVTPICRSTGIGKSLVGTAIDFGKKRGWPFLEVGAPKLPKWQKTVNFYNRIGFKEIGPRLELALLKKIVR